MNPKWLRSGGVVKNTEAGRGGGGCGGGAQGNNKIISTAYIFLEKHPDPTAAPMDSFPLRSQIASARQYKLSRKNGVGFFLSLLPVVTSCAHFKMSLVTFWIRDNLKRCNFGLLSTPKVMV